jgi:spore germination cell wall hydrolase CwlJ-like protein
MKYKRAQQATRQLHKERFMKKIILFCIVVLLIITLFIPIAQAKATKTPDGKIKYTYTEAEINELTRVVYAEARNQPFYGRAAVALTAIYRYENNKGKYSMRHITRHGQYAKAGRWILTSKKKGVIASVKKCREAVMYAIDHRILPKNCTMFQRANRKHWGRNKNIPRYCRIGDHTFYTVGKAKAVPGNMYIDTSGQLVKR